MTSPVLLLIVANFACIGLLTVFFFQPAHSINIRWFATALPHLACPSLLVLTYFTDVAPLTPLSWARLLALIAVPLSVASVALMFFTLGTHRVKLAHFHQQDDAPVGIVTEGPYRWIRHPFYASYLLLYLAVALAFPHWWTLAVLGYVSVGFTLTASGEERRLMNSEFGAEYRAYLARTGRFLPRLGRVLARPDVMGEPR